MDENASLDSLLHTPIPVLSNQLILRLLEERRITINPFSADKLGPTAYRLCPSLIRFHVEDEDGIVLAPENVHLDVTDGRDLRPGEYAVVSPKEQIVLSKGFVADFYPSSWCIENKLVLTAGRLDAGYDAALVFGVLNAGRVDVCLKPSFQLVRVTFGWLGSDNMPVYGETAPGAYIHELARLREREAELDLNEERLRQQRAEITRARKELLTKRNAGER